MYKAPIAHSTKTGKKIGEAYYDKFVLTYRAALQKKLSNRRPWSEGIFGHRNDKVVMKLLPGSKAEAFIKHCIKSDRFMRTLLYGDMDQMLAMFQILVRWVDNPWELRKLSDQDKLNLSQQQRQGAGPVCHFHSVVKRVFVETLYETELDKEWVFRWKLLKYCPYCGDGSVAITNHVDANGKNVVSKTVLDHYLPKSEFPYFAVNIFNLYPCCWRCNSADLKGSNIPIERDATGTYHYLIMHPHHYEDSRLSFNYIPSSPQHPNDDIELSCSDPYIEKGYKNILGLEALYKNYIDEARDMIDRANEYLNQYAVSYGKQTFGFDKRFLQYYVRSTLGFNPYGKNPYEVQRYKFRMDIFRQLNRQYNIQIT